MKSKFLRLCSIILVMVLVINMLPMHVWAAQIGQTGAIGQIDADTEVQNLSVDRDLDLSSVHILSEITDKRTEYTKEFRLDNGLIMASVYNEPVHYEKDGRWEDIDNTLVARIDDGNTVYTNAAGLWNVQFPQQMSSSNPISITKDGYTLSFRLDGELAIPGGVAVMNIGDHEADAFTVQSAHTASAQIVQYQSAVDKENAQFAETVLDKINSRLSYADVFSNTSVVYDLQSNKVKESIIMESYNDTLRGYRYTLEVGSLIPVLADDGHIDFYDENRENIVMVMPAPFLVDANNDYCSDVTVQLSGSGSTYSLSYLLPVQWLASENREWPVILDPVVQANTNTSNIRDQMVTEKRVIDYKYHIIECGYYQTKGIERIFVKYNQLPVLGSSDVVVAAYMQLKKMETSTNTVPVEVHKVNGTWESESITWSNMPDCDTTIEDYALVRNEGVYTWDITDIAREWYETGENTGMMFKASDAVEQAADNRYQQFYSSDYSTWGDTEPTLTLLFRNNNGLESYWDYTSASAGRAGTGHINNYTGNLVWVHSDMGFGGNRMPVSISHVYNANDTDNNNFGMGMGWRTNYNQKVYQWTQDTNYYVWEDSDGTDHYFLKESTGVYKDEDGLELTLTTTGSGTTKYKITDKNGNASYFDTNGRLSKLENNQATKSNISITYTTTTGWLISTVTDGVGRVYSFTYTNNLLSKISYKGTGSSVITYVNYGYTGSDLTSITDKDGKTVRYTYGTNHLLTSATDVDGYKLSYTYNTTEVTVPNRVATVTETDDSVQGGKLKIDYAHNQTTFTEILKNGSSANQLIYQFNNWGNTVSIQDGEGRAEFARWATDTNTSGAKGNQLSLTSKLQNTVGNVVKNSTFESAVDWRTNKNTLVASSSSEFAYHGTKSLKLKNSANAEVYALGPTFTIQPNETYTFSAYIKTVDTYVNIGITDYSNYQTSFGPGISANSDWTRLELSYTNTTSTVKTMMPSFCVYNVGAVYVDSIQVEKAPTASRYNLIENGDFRHSGTPAYSWTGTNLGTSDGCVSATSAAPQLDATVLKIVGSPTSQKRLSQTVKVSGSEGDTLILSGWAKGNAAPDNMEGAEPDGTINDRVFGLVATLNYTDNTTEKVTVAFNPDVENWQYIATPIVPTKAYSSVKVEIAYDYNVNTMLFDGIQLYKEEFGSSYTYDDEGNVTSVVDLQKMNTTYEYDTNGNLTKVLQDNKAKMTYTYDGYHNVKTATSVAGVIYSFTYDTYGNNTKVSITSDGKTLSSSAVYTNNGNTLASTTDAAGKVTTYSYDPNTNVLLWVKYPNDTDASRTEYTYDTMYRLASAQADVGSQTLSAAYTYADDLLTQIQTGSTTYSFSYGNFALRSAITIGDRTLASYEYTNDGRNSLYKLVYGNEDMVQYTYDAQGRVTKQTYEDGDTVSYGYDNNGALATVKDSASGITSKYYYDFTDRLCKYTESADSYSFSMVTTYDNQNRVTEALETTNGYARSIWYNYDSANRLISYQKGWAREIYQYDSFGRQRYHFTSYRDTTVLTNIYTYETPADDKTTSRVAAFTNRYGGRDVVDRYTYDDNGNILTISDGTYTTSYTYDTANQLTRENNQKAGKTWVWTYDNAGNILSRMEYAYTTGTLGTALDTVSYGYTDSAWGDLLTSYDGQTITSDEIGNMLFDGTWTYTWEHGRELASMSDGSTTWSMTYNADGLRTKRTNGTKTYNYTYYGGQLVHMSVDGSDMYFSTSPDGVPMAVTYQGTQYLYVTNLQGDVTAILDTSGNTVVEYTYDAWGNILTTTGSMASTLGKDNPLRYRGYVYDPETRLYYLQSRYYNSEMGRFINADAFASTGQGLLGNNLFTYCQNTPINYIDPYGTAFMPIGAGFQFEIDAGNGTVGIEIIVYWDVEECSNGGLVIAVYTYGGLSVPCNDPYLGSILAVITDNSQILSEGNEEAIIAIATLLSDTFDIAVSGVLITGNEDFINTESYNGSFTSIGGNLGKLKGSVAYSENCIGYALGYNVVGSIFSAGWGISKTIYTQIYEFRLFGEADNIPKHGGLGGKF